MGAVCQVGPEGNTKDSNIHPPTFVGQPECLLFPVCVSATADRVDEPQPSTQGASPVADTCPVPAVYTALCLALIPFSQLYHMNSVINSVITKA